MTLDNVVQSITIVLGGGGLIGFVLSLLKVRPEAGQMVVTAAQGALAVQTGVIENLRAEVARLTKEISEMYASNQELRKQLKILQDVIIDMQDNQKRHDEQVAELQNVCPDCPNRKPQPK